MALAKVKFATKNGNAPSNIFLDMLKVAPLVELADVDEKSVEEVVLGEDSDDNDDGMGNDVSAANDVIFVGEVTPPPSTSSNSSKRSNQSGSRPKSSGRHSLSSGRHSSLKWVRKRALRTKNKVVRFAPMEAKLSETFEEFISSAPQVSLPENEEKKCVETTFISRIRPTFLSPPVPPNNYVLHGLRYFEEIQAREVASAHQFRPESFKIVSYNVLSQDTMLRTRFLYTHLTGRNTRFGIWGQRFRILSDEFDRLRADVFCLQEVDGVHMESFYRPFFEKLGYAGIYCRKTNKKPDGCAIFYSATKYYPRKCFEVFYNLNVEPMNCDNIGQVIALEILETKSVVCVSNTHLVYNPTRGNAKISQVAYLFGKMNEMEQLIRAEMSPDEHFVGHILCGDFNMEPFSPIYRFIVDAKLRMHKFTSQDLARSLEELEIVGVSRRRSSDGSGAARVNLAVMRLSNACIFQTVTSFPMCDSSSCKNLTHSFKLASVYEHKLADSSKEISFRPVDEELCPDFIFYSVGEPKTSDTPIAESYIQLRGRLTLPCLRDLDSACGPMPNSQTGSDHLPLLAHFHLLCK